MPHTDLSGQQKKKEELVGSGKIRADLGTWSNLVRKP